MHWFFSIALIRWDLGEFYRCLRHGLGHGLHLSQVENYISSAHTAFSALCDSPTTPSPPPATLARVSARFSLTACRSQGLHHSAIPISVEGETNAQHQCSCPPNNA